MVLVVCRNIFTATAGILSVSVIDLFINFANSSLGGILQFLIFALTIIIQIITVIKFYKKKRHEK